MPAITRVGDKCTGHDNCPAVPLVEGIAKVRVNGKPIGVVGCAYQAHGCVAHSTHTPHIVQGSSKVRVNGKPVARVGDAVDCGGTVAEGSSNVRCN